MTDAPQSVELVALAERIELWRWAAAGLHIAGSLAESPLPSKPPVHRPPGVRSGAEVKAALDRQRPSAARRGYGPRWRRARAAYLARHPLCVPCAAAGRLALATVVDHVVPHHGDQRLFWDESNWQGLCKPCHDAKTAREGRWG